MQVDQRREQLAASFTRTQVADILGVSRQTVSDMAADGRSSGSTTGGSGRFPIWQFTPDRADPVLPDLDRLPRAGIVTSDAAGIPQPQSRNGWRRITTTA
ncbi:hypothetical protein R1CP_39385 (plasmid) [Rhodococcus opacus]|uniref:Uncharacterized protein n=1 Tax=Rhodococcus opacus TaxID=37919 RepID=A0A1B1KIR8_RHOOP|nr:hypothetical protein [Rhodococcus opacus]ANS32460.1 hypothetical protein R1CP_39385 [Rhodococcus opacus]